MTAATQQGDLRDDGRDETRARLIDAAAEVFAERGYERAGVAEIARRAGLTTGAIYGRYSGKADLLLDAIDARACDEIQRLLGGGASALAALGAHLVERGPDDGQALLLEAFVAARRDPQVAAMMRRRIQDQDAHLAKLVEEGKADGTVDTELSTDAVVAFSHAIGLGFLLYRSIDHELPPRDEWIKVIDRVIEAAAIKGGRP